ncbi:MAG: hypothetical protein FWF82_04335 [Oscillospiraceae bacterium]|nr:hypothetical protein [Oscillospiraceae bacterium]
MMSFKEQMERDLDSVFLNTDEFADIHRVDGKEIPAVIDKDGIVKLKKGQVIGMAESDMLLMAKVGDLPPQKSPGSFFNVDGREYIVESWNVNAGLAEIALNQNRRRS